MKIGTTEILLILIIALFVIGPDRLPEFMQKLGKGLKQFRRFSSEATKEIRENVVEPLNEAQKPLRDAVEPVAELGREVTSDVNSIRKSFTDLKKPMKATPPETQPENSASGTDSQAEKSVSGTESQSEVTASETELQTKKSASEGVQPPDNGQPSEPAPETTDVAPEDAFGTT